MVGFVKYTQHGQWQRFCAVYPSNPEQKFLERVAEQLDKSDPNAADQTIRTFGTNDGGAGNDRLRRPAGVAPGATGLNCARRG